ncbi:MAG TPA: hypothetical protein VK966_07010, partial [Longimicrobiales bacterium]|nr:hypothetical protein [Longimicrobiales bacterium]
MKKTMNDGNNVKSRREVQVALAGCGTVGGELVRQLERRADAIEEARGLRFRITRVLVRDAARPRPEQLRPEVITTDVDEFLHAATRADVVVEAVGGLDPAAAIAAAALEHGRAFV